jgi:pseudouridine synthase
MLVRLNKFIASSGAASRREADRLIEAGRVKVNGRVIRTLGHKVESDTDRVEVNGRAVKPASEAVYLMLHKPPMFLVTRKDPYNRPTVMELLPPHMKGLFPVGRLDFDSQGLLLMTNDGVLAYRLLHPRYGVTKLYRVKVAGHPDAAALKSLERGVYLEGKKTAPARIKPMELKAHYSWLEIELHEGRKREVRRMLEQVGHQVMVLKRVRFAGLSLGGLRSGAWRNLSAGEVRRLKKKVGLLP